MIRFFLFLLCFFVAASGYAQRRIDSLRTLSGLLSGKDRVDVLNKLSLALSSRDLNQSGEVAATAMQVSEKLNYGAGKAEGLINESVVAFRTGHDSLAIRLLLESISLAQKDNARHLQGYALTHLGRVYKRMDQLEDAFNYLTQSYELLKDSVQLRYLCELYLEFSDYYELRNQPVRQLGFLKKAWNLSRKLNDNPNFTRVSQRFASYYTESGDYQEAISYLTAAWRKLGSDTVDNREVTNLQRQMGIVYAHSGDLVKSIQLLTKCRQFLERNGCVPELMQIQSETGRVFADFGDYEISLKIYFEALSLAETNRYDFERTKLLFRIAWVYYLLEQEETSLKFALSAMDDARGHHHPFEEASILNLLGLLADRQNKNEESMRYFQEALRIRQEHQFREGIGSTLLNIGILLEKQQKFRDALDFDLRSLQMEESIQHGVGMAYSYQSLGQLYTKMKDYKKAHQFLDQGERLSKAIKASNILRDVYENRRDLYIVQKNFAEAVRYSILFENLKDSIFNDNLSSRIGALQNRFELDQKDREIKILGQQKEIQERKLEIQNAQIRQQWIIISFAFASVLLAGIIAYIIFRYYRNIKKLNIAITEQNEEIQTQSEELTEANDALAKLNREISEQKEEIQAQAEELTESNQTISRVNDSLEEKILRRTNELQQAYRELDTFFYRSSHDFRRPLTTFMGLAEVAKITIKDDSALELFRKVDETAHNLDRMLMKLQSISDVGAQELIYKEVLIKEIFQLEVDNVEKELQEKNIHVSTEVELKHSFYSYPALVKIIIQNLLENAIAFSNPVDPWINLRAYEQGPEMVIEVKDNGQGIEDEYKERVFEMYFRANARSKGNGLGLYIVKKTAQKLNGRIEMATKHNQGTTVRIYFPSHTT